MTCECYDKELRLYRVTITCDVWVIAETRDDAEKILQSDDGRDVLSQEVRHGATAHAVQTTSVTGPAINDLPWRADSAIGAPDATLREWAYETAQLARRDARIARDRAAQTTIPGVTL